MEVIKAELEKIAVLRDLKSARVGDVLEKVKIGLRKSKEFIQKRQKVIRLADRSKFRWDLVNEH